MHLVHEHDRDVGCVAVLPVGTALGPRRELARQHAGGAEEDVGLRRGRPLIFSDERYQALETLWRAHGIPREVSQIRSTSDRVIRDNWY